MKDPCIACDNIGKRNSFLREYQDQLSEILKNHSINPSFQETKDVPISKDGKLTEATQKNDMTPFGKMNPDQKYSELFKTCRDGIVFIDMQGRILDCNPVYSEMLGYTLDELNNLTYQELTPAKWYEVEKDIVKNQFLKKGYSECYEKEYIRKDGTIVPISINGWLITDDLGKPVGMWGFVRDITDLKKHNESLHESQQEIKAVFESSADCIIVWDRDYNYLYANQVAIDHVGTTRDNVIGKNIRDGLGHVPEFMNLWMKRIDEVFETCKSMRVEDADYIGDKLVYSQSVLSPIKNSSGDIFAVSVVYRDITDKMELHKQVEEMAEKYKNLYNNALTPLYRTRLSDGKLIECNEKMAELLGYQSKEECLRNHYSTNHYADPEQREKFVGLLKENGKVDEFVVQTQKVDGSLLWVKVSAKLNSDRTCIEGAMHDITASKILSEAELMVLKLVLKGKANKDIADELKRSVRTIEVHRSHIMHRMGVNNLVELAKESVKLGLG